MSSGIEVGTAIATLVKTGSEGDDTRMLYRDFNESAADARRNALVASLEAEDAEGSYRAIEPQWQLGYPFTATRASSEYLEWPLLTEVFAEKFPGVKTSRDELVVGATREELERKIGRYFDEALSDDELAREFPNAMRTTSRYRADSVRRALLERGCINENLMRYAYRPFDWRYLYWEMNTKLLDEKRREYRTHVSHDNLWLTSTGKTRREAFYQPQVSTHPFDLNVIEANVQVFPLLLQTSDGALDYEGEGGRANLTELAESYLDALGCDPPTLFHHVVASLHSPAYAEEIVSEPASETVQSFDPVAMLAPIVTRRRKSCLNGVPH